MSGIEAGIYGDMPNADYHAQTDWLSSTQLKRALPERYKTGGSRDALDFGSLFHTLALEPAKVATFAEENGITVLDPKAVGLKADGKPSDSPTSTKAWKDVVAAVEADGRRVMTQADWDEWVDRATAMVDAIRNHETAAELMFNRDGQAEESVFADVNGVPCKARFDRRIPGVILDLKSTSTKPGADSIARAVIDYGYDLSAAHYLAVAEAAGLEVDAFAFVFVSKTAPHYVTVCDLDETFLARGRVLRALAIERLANAADAYEGATGFLTLDCPRWARLGVA